MWKKAAVSTIVIKFHFISSDYITKKHKSFLSDDHLDIEMEITYIVTNKINKIEIPWYTNTN